jgi:hypothetical protein
VAIYYCHGCAAARSIIRKPPSESDLIGTSYQLDKYIKHTVPNPSYNVQSVFNSASTQVYARYVVESMGAGSVEVDHRGRNNVIWYAGQPTGFLYERGVVKLPEHGVKVVLTMTTGKIHPYPIVVPKPMLTTPCADCSKPILS